MCGPAQGWTKYFFYPGFTARTGGLLREPDLLAAPERSSTAEPGWRSWASHWRGERLVSLFCYEPPALADLLDAAGNDAQPTLPAGHRRARQRCRARRSSGQNTLQPLVEQA